MILLTDVDTRGQAMGYCLGSHRVSRGLASFVSNKLSVEAEREHSEIGEISLCNGSAGDAFVFDSNGAHSATRSASAPVRDVVTLEYTVSPSLVFGVGGEVAGFERLDAAQQDVFSVLQAKAPSWERTSRRLFPMWIESLSDIDGWRPAPAQRYP